MPNSGLHLKYGRVPGLRVGLYACFISNSFTSNNMLKLTKTQSKAKQHPEVKFLLFANCLLSSFTLSSKNDRACSKKCAKDRSICFNDI